LAPHVTLLRSTVDLLTSSPRCRGRRGPEPLVRSLIDEGGDFVEGLEITRAAERQSSPAAMKHSGLAVKWGALIAI